jgi:hypothetical protein
MWQTGPDLSMRTKLAKHSFQTRYNIDFLQEDFIVKD